MDEILGQVLRGAVWERIDLLDDLADTADDHSLTSVTRAELPRLTDFWRELLADHQVDDRGGCATCSSRWRQSSGPCDTWRLAYEHLCAERPRTSAGRTVPRPRLSMPTRTVFESDATTVTDRVSAVDVS